MSKELQHGLDLLKRESTLKEKNTALVITVTTQKLKNDFEIFPLRFFLNYVCLPIGVKNTASGMRMAQFFDGKVDVVFVDAENKLRACENLFDKVFSSVKKSKIFPVKGNDFTADSAFSIIFTILKNVSKKNILIVGAGNIGSKVALKFIECGSRVFIINSTKLSTLKRAKAINEIKPAECRSKVIPITKDKVPASLDCIIGFTRGTPVITSKMISNLKKDGLLLDGGTGTITKSGIEEARRRKLIVLRLDIRIGFEYYASLILGTSDFVTNIVGKKKIGMFSIVSGGFIGKEGDVVVDNIKKPRRIIGISNGMGGILKDVKHNKNVDIVKKLIY